MILLYCLPIIFTSSAFNSVWQPIQASNLPHSDPAQASPSFLFSISVFIEIAWSDDLSLFPGSWGFLFTSQFIKLFISKALR